MITIHLIPASYGDTLLLSVYPVDQTQRETFLLIDCGLRYKASILPIIKDLKKAGKRLDRFIVTHYDNDHIHSATKLIKENGALAEPKIISIEQVWLNTYRHLQDEPKAVKELSKEEELLLEEFMADHQEFGGPDEDGHEINAEQASFLGKELLAKGYPWNSDFGGKAVCIENGREVLVNGTVKLTLLSPTAAALHELKAEFEAMLKKLKIPLSGSEKIDDAFALYVQQGGHIADLPSGYEISGTGKINEALIRKLSDGSGYDADGAAANGSSIAFILEANGKKLLLLADAHAEMIMTQLNKVYGDDANYPIYFDAVKVAHHGSYRNNHPDLFKLIDSPKWLFSTNGLHQSHAHPDLQTIALIVNRKLTHGITERELIFNHTLEHMEGLDDPELKATFHYTVKMQTFIELDV
ncbi:MBL fold metallo-hydrolase [Mucilaginibacter pocheonensis]|uniref:Beta-lactamase superfamily II metal-dependent hydrolase n=1 Tax=Mucilaginibacter pocheonensis TaxID=398050 RepID=A0ABU1TE08_9SPHI|nr:MBL fold metallo-hydrolase [Mucilaginibacter pocheonensis]MDR6943644.1 beta-lactamase superfamily II metal-dependent hydrolase [Mucilaginibacter pocheonensis]